MIDSRKYGRCQLIQGNLAKQKKQQQPILDRHKGDKKIKKFLTK